MKYNSLLLFIVEFSLFTIHSLLTCVGILFINKTKSSFSSLLISRELIAHVALFLSQISLARFVLVASINPHSVLKAYVNTDCLLLTVVVCVAANDKCSLFGSVAKF